MPVMAPMPRDERRLMQKAIHKAQNKNYARMLMLHRDDRVNDVARTARMPDAGVYKSGCIIVRNVHVNR